MKRTDNPLRMRLRAIAGLQPLGARCFEQKVPDWHTEKLAKARASFRRGQAQKKRGTA